MDPYDWIFDMIICSRNLGGHEIGINIHGPFRSKIRSIPTNMHTTALQLEIKVKMAMSPMTFYVYA